MHFHNKIYANLKGNPNKRFLLARAIVEASYRVIILNDILPLILSDEEMGKLRKGCHFWNHYDVNKEFVQFHAAVFRFGHSMVQPSYRLNESYQATLIRKMNDGFQDDLKGDTPLEEKLIIDWRHFFNFENPMCIQYSSKINTKICRPLFHVFQSSESNPLLSSIAYRTLVLNYKLELPNAKAVLNHFGITPQLNDNHFTDLEYKLDDVPLWLYILKEAEIEMYGTKLGKLGSLLTARTFHHLLSLYDMDKEAIIATAFFSKKQISITDIINYTLN
jgi:Animal haem peroxidase